MTASVSGRIDGLTAGSFESQVNGAISDDDAGVIVELSNLTYLSSAGLRSMLLIAKTLSQKSVSFCLCSVPASILEIIKIAGFDRIIDIVDTYEAAIEKISS